ncbi:MAG TPA: class I tRNA ligase family protein, partial [Anaerolineales bacterium]
QLQDGGDRAYYTAATLVRVLDLCLRMLHPFIPFVTEEIWGTLRKSLQGTPLSTITESWQEALIIATWPDARQPEGWENEAVSNFTLMQEIVRTIRNIRAEKNVKPGKLIPAILSAGEKTGLFRQQKGMISALAQLDAEKIQIPDQMPPKQENYVAIAMGPAEVYLPLEGLVDTSEELARLQKALVEAESQVNRLEKLLSGSFAEKAPAEIVQKEKEKLVSYRETVENIKKQLVALK